MSLAIVTTVNSGGDVAYLLQCRFYLHKVVDVELHGIAVLLPHLAGNEYGIMQRPLGLFQSGLQVVHGVLPVLRRRYSPGTAFCREILFACHVTVVFARKEKRVSVAYATRTRAYDGRYEKGRQSHTFSGLPAVPLPFPGRFSITPLPLCRLFAFVGNRSGRLFRHLFSLARLGRFLGRLFEAGEVRGEIHGVADSLCSGMDCLLEITV